MVSRSRLASVARHVGAAIAAGTGAAGSVGLLAYVQARLAEGRPGEGDVGYWVDGDVGPADADAHRVVWLGDSLAAGLGAIAPEMTLPHLVATTGGRRTRLHVFATPGATSADVVRDQLPALGQLGHGLAQIGRHIDAVGITVGANDIAAFTPRRQFAANVAEIVAAADGLPLIFVSIPDLADAIRLPRPLRTLASWRADWLDVVLRRVARSHTSVHYASVRTRPHWISRRDRVNFLAKDRFHPSGAGYAVWADRVWEVFDAALHLPVKDDPLPV